MDETRRKGTGAARTGSGGRADVRPVLSPLAVFAASHASPAPSEEQKLGLVAPVDASTGVKVEHSRVPSSSSDVTVDSSVGAAVLVGSEGRIAPASKEETPNILVERASDSTSGDASVSSGRHGSEQADVVAGTSSRNADEASGSEELDFLNCSSDEDDVNEHKSDSGVGERRSSDANTAEEPGDLYEISTTHSEAGGTSQTSIRSQPKGASIRLPSTSDVELFHSVLVKDIESLEATLRELSPTEVLDIRDADQRTLYHYGVLSPDRRVQRAVFSHVDSYSERRLASQLGKVMEEKGVVDQWLSKCPVGKNDWEPPSVKELTLKFVKMQQQDWEMICRAVDRDNRSILHYAASVPGRAVFEQDAHFGEVIRSKRDLAHARDVDSKMPLHLAVEAGNVYAIKWYFSLGIRLNQEDVSRLLQLNQQKLVREVLAQQLERIDTQAYHGLGQGDREADQDGWELGLGILARIEVDRAQGRPSSRQGSSLLIDAARYGNVNAVELLLREGASPSACDSNGWTAIHVCADEGTDNHLAIMRLLLDPPHSVAVDSKSLKGRTPLHIAVKATKGGGKSREEILRTLCEYGADSSARDRQGNTALYLASRSNSVSVISSLIGLGCSVAAVDNNGRNCLHMAGNTEVVKYLLSWEEGEGYLSNAADNRGRKPIEVARNEQTRQLLTSQWSLCHRGNAEGVKRLLVRADAASSQAFTTDRTVQTMRTPLHVALQGYLDSLQPPESSKLKRASHSATHQVDQSSVQYQRLASLLLHAGADPCAADKWGITPIMVAAAIDDEQLLETLLESCLSSKSLQDTDRDGNTALHYSYAFCNAKNSSILEDAMDDDEPTNNNGKTPLEMTGFRNRIFPSSYRTHQREAQRYAVLLT